MCATRYQRKRCIGSAYDEALAQEKVAPPNTSSPAAGPSTGPTAPDDGSATMQQDHSMPREGEFLNLAVPPPQPHDHRRWRKGTLQQPQHPVPPPPARYEAGAPDSRSTPAPPSSYGPVRGGDVLPPPPDDAPGAPGAPPMEEPARRRFPVGLFRPMSKSPRRTEPYDSARRPLVRTPSRPPIRGLPSPDQAIRRGDLAAAVRGLTAVFNGSAAKSPVAEQEQHQPDIQMETGPALSQATEEPRLGTASDWRDGEPAVPQGSGHDPVVPDVPQEESNEPARDGPESSIPLSAGPQVDHDEPQQRDFYIGTPPVADEH